MPAHLTFLIWKVDAYTKPELYMLATPRITPYESGRSSETWGTFSPSQGPVYRYVLGLSSVLFYPAINCRTLNSLSCKLAVHNGKG
jgi:hypothetical protein